MKMKVTHKKPTLREKLNNHHNKAGSGEGYLLLHIAMLFCLPIIGNIFVLIAQNTARQKALNEQICHRINEEES